MTEYARWLIWNQPMSLVYVQYICTPAHMRLSLANSTLDYSQGRKQMFQMTILQCWKKLKYIQQMLDDLFRVLAGQ